MPPLTPDIPPAPEPPRVPAAALTYGNVESGSDLRGRTGEAHTPRARDGAVDWSRLAIELPTPGDMMLPIVTDADIVGARQHGRALALRLGLSAPDATLVATAVSELARNIILYATAGEIVLRPLQRDGRPGVLVIARDEGPGIADASHVADGPLEMRSTMGLGLRGTKLLMDEFTIHSQIGRGTTIVVTKWRS